MSMNAKEVARQISQSTICDYRKDMLGKVKLIEPAIEEKPRSTLKLYMANVTKELINLERKKHVRRTDRKLAADDVNYDWLKERVKALHEYLGGDIATCMFKVLPFSLNMDYKERSSLYFKLLSDLQLPE